MKVSQSAKADRTSPRATESGEERSLRIEELRRQIATGTFRIDSKKIAETLMMQMSETQDSPNPPSASQGVKRPSDA